MSKITVSAIINASIDKVWEKLNNPKDIEKWNFASDEWHCINAENNLVKDGSLKSTMAAKDGSFSFDFEGIYDEIIPYQLIKYHLTDLRKVEIRLEEMDNGIVVTETFDAESENPLKMQQHCWQAILNNFKKYVENC